MKNNPSQIGTQPIWVPNFYFVDEKKKTLQHRKIIVFPTNPSQIGAQPTLGGVDLRGPGGGGMLLAHIEVDVGGAQLEAVDQPRCLVCNFNFVNFILKVSAIIAKVSVKSAKVSARCLVYDVQI